MTAPPPHTQPQQQGFCSAADRNPLEDTKRVVETLKKNGAVDNLHSQAINVLFQSEAFKSQVRQWLQRKRDKPTSSREDVDALLEMALAAFVGLLAGTVDLQQQQPQSQGGAAAADAGGRSSQPSEPQQQSLQQQQRLGLGGAGQQQQHPQQQQRGSLMQQQQRPGSAAGPSRGPQQQPRQQPQPQVNISEEVALKLQLAVLDMLEAEEKFLQGAFRRYYTDQLHRLQHHRPLPLLRYTARAPKDVEEGPLSPVGGAYDAADDAASQWDAGMGAEEELGGGGGGMGSRSTSQQLPRQFTETLV